MLRHLEVHQIHRPTYILENLPLFGDIRTQLMANIHEVRSWIEATVLLDATSIESLAHCL